MEEKEFFMNPICRGEFESEAEMTDAILDAMSQKGIEVRGWLPSPERI